MTQATEAANEYNLAFNKGEANASLPLSLTLPGSAELVIEIAHIDAGSHVSKFVTPVAPNAYDVAGVFLASVAVFAILSPPASAQTLRGHLLGAADDRPIDLGLIMMLTEAGDSVTYTITDERGYFSVTSPAPGSFRLLASALGYGESEAGLFDLGMGGQLTVEFRMAAEPLPIDAMLVSIDRPVLEHALIRNGFVRRYQRTAGGRFLTPHDIETSAATTTEGLLAAVPGLTVRPARGNSSYLGDRVLMRGPSGWCEPVIYVDGVRTRYDIDSGLSLSTVVPLASVAAVEIYRGLAEIPVEYSNSVRESPGGPAIPICGVMLFWTRQGR